MRITLRDAWNARPRPREDRARLAGDAKAAEQIAKGAVAANRRSGGAQEANRAAAGSDKRRPRSSGCYGGRRAPRRRLKERAA